MWIKILAIQQMWLLVNYQEIVNLIKLKTKKKDVTTVTTEIQSSGVATNSHMSKNWKI